MFADSKYHNYALYEWVEDNADWSVEVVRRPPGATGLGEVADPMDGGADVRVAGAMPAAEQGPGEERAVVRGDCETGHDPPNAQPSGFRPRRRTRPSNITPPRETHLWDSHQTMSVVHSTRSAKSELSEFAPRQRP